MLRVQEWIRKERTSVLLNIVAVVRNTAAEGVTCGDVIDPSMRN